MELGEALAVVAGAAPGGAIAQQIGRLLDAGPDRGDLVVAAVRFRDQLTDRHPALAGLLLDALRHSGVTELPADGEMFDPAHHQAVGTVSATHRRDHGRVAETVRPGYLDGTSVLRLPQVVVRRYEPPEEDQ